ncbi:hypothetical protein DFH06DRAFT_1303562 [Mycena polygramma]|nr:hypothetical protein DFH06DRAFT_1303562 [Mycena polygramma]
MREMPGVWSSSRPPVWRVFLGLVPQFKHSCAWNGQIHGYPHAPERAVRLGVASARSSATRPEPHFAARYFLKMLGIPWPLNKFLPDDYGALETVPTVHLLCPIAIQSPECSTFWFNLYWFNLSSTVKFSQFFCPVPVALKVLNRGKTGITLVQLLTTTAGPGPAFIGTFVTIGLDFRLSALEVHLTRVARVAADRVNVLTSSDKILQFVCESNPVSGSLDLIQWSLRETMGTSGGFAQYSRRLRQVHQDAHAVVHGLQYTQARLHLCPNKNPSYYPLELSAPVRGLLKGAQSRARPASSRG